MKRQSLLMGLVLAPALGFADGFDYTYVDAGIVNSELDAGPLDVDGDGLSFSGSFALNDQLFLVGGYSDQEYDFDLGLGLGLSFDTSMLNVGVGFHTSLSQNLDFVADLSYVDAEVYTPFGTLDESGYGIGAGIRTRAGDSFEIDAGLRYLDLSGSDTELGLGVRYYFSDSFAVRGGVADNDGGLGWNVGARWDFGGSSDRRTAAAR